MKKLIMLMLMLMLVVAGCGSGESSDSTPTDLPTVPPILPVSSYTNWISSANGEYVNDATNDRVRFRTDNGYMVFGNTYYVNMRIIPGGNGDIYFNGAKVGAVTYIRSTSGSVITGLVCPNGYMADIYGFESNLNIQCSTIVPVFVTGKLSGKLTLSDVVLDAEGANGKPNAIADTSVDAYFSYKSGTIHFNE